MRPVPRRAGRPRGGIHSFLVARHCWCRAQVPPRNGVRPSRSPTHRGQSRAARRRPALRALSQRCANSTSLFSPPLDAVVWAKPLAVPPDGGHDYASLMGITGEPGAGHAASLHSFSGARFRSWGMRRASVVACGLLFFASLPPVVARACLSLEPAPKELGYQPMALNG